MASEKGLTRYNGVCQTRPRRIAKGQKKKKRRVFRAIDADGWERKKANGLRPQRVTSKSLLRSALKHEACDAL